ncbi:hypothetical protein Q7C36_007578 [Tachysurus vachellii]|uniref:Ataxin-2 C-terminal domain-containing protein n=2 Tax=Tachysurus TaxID=641818 RepID=A0AA88T362_TACVA|nr:hypothetical protein Q7C36_007578 [Tachysurus vachellii]
MNDPDVGLKAGQVTVLPKKEISSITGVVFGLIRDKNVDIMPEPAEINSPEVAKTPGGSSGSGKEDSMLNGHKEGEANPFAEYMWMENEEEYNRQVEEELLEQEFLERCFQEMLEEEDQDWFIPARDLPSGVGHIQQQFSGLSVNDSNAEDIARKSSLNPEAKEFVPGVKY